MTVSPTARLGALAEELKAVWSASSVNVGALGCYIRYYDKFFELETVQGTVKGIPATVRNFAPASMIVLKPEFRQNRALFGGGGGGGDKGGGSKAGDKTSEEHAVQQLVEHVTKRTRDGKVTKMSALAGLFLNAKDKSILSRFGDLRRVLLKYNGTLKGFLEHHKTVFSIVDDARIGDCTVEVWALKRGGKPDGGGGGGGGKPGRKEAVPAHSHTHSEVSSADERDCPLCCEPFDTTDMEFQSCECSYRVCVWCFHRIKDQGDSKCPSCRNTYQDGGVTLTEKQRAVLRQRRQQSPSTAEVNVGSSRKPETAAPKFNVKASGGSSSPMTDAPGHGAHNVGSAAGSSGSKQSSAVSESAGEARNRLAAREKAAAAQRTGNVQRQVGANQGGPGNNAVGGNVVVRQGNANNFSEDAVVKLLVDKINARTRDNKTTKASALAGGLFQADGRYGDLRPVLLKYEGTIHGFLRHHKAIFLLEDPLGRPNSDDPIVRVRPSSGPHSMPSSSNAGHNSAPAGHLPRQNSAPAGKPAAATSNPWKMDTKQSQSSQQQSRPNHQGGGLQRQGRSVEMVPPAAAAAEPVLRMRSAADIGGGMLPTAIFDDDDDLSADDLSAGSLPIGGSSFNSMPHQSQPRPSTLFGAPIGAPPPASNHGWGRSASHGESGAGGPAGSSYGDEGMGGAAGMGGGAIRSSRWVSMTSDGGDQDDGGAGGSRGGAGSGSGHAGMPSGQMGGTAGGAAAGGGGGGGGVGSSSSSGGGGGGGGGSAAAASSGGPGGAAWAPAAVGGSSAFGDIWGTASDIDSAFSGADPGAAFGSFGAAAVSASLTPQPAASGFAGSRFAGGFDSPGFDPLGRSAAGGPSPPGQGQHAEGNGLNEQSRFWPPRPA